MKSARKVDRRGIRGMSGSGKLGYAGDVSPRQAWDELARNDKATLVDVRTGAEWSFVGVPDLAPVGKTLVLLEWQGYPAMEINRGFADALAAELGRRGVGPGDPLFFICRSGVRSAAAAAAASAAGYGQCFNVAGGFEGGLDGERHRGRIAGWKAEGLPWVQS